MSFIKTNKPTPERESVPAKADSSFIDNRSSTVAQRALQHVMHASPHAVAQRAQQTYMANAVVSQQKSRQQNVIQPVGDGKLSQEKFAPLQPMEDEELLQGKFSEDVAPQSPPPITASNNTGLPDQLKAGIENLSGMSMDHVNVHYNSAKPAQLQAHAYAQGSDIHVAPGQEQHLPHEAWHVVQQAQGRVKPTLQMKSGESINNDAGLEAEADVMGAKALDSGHVHQPSQLQHTAPAQQQVVQKKWFRMSTIFDKQDEEDVLNIQGLINQNNYLEAFTEIVKDYPAMAISYRSILHFTDIDNTQASVQEILKGTYGQLKAYTAAEVMEELEALTLNARSTLFFGHEVGREFTQQAKINASLEIIQSQFLLLLQHYPWMKGHFNLFHNGFLDTNQELINENGWNDIKHILPEELIGNIVGNIDEEIPEDDDTFSTQGIVESDVQNSDMDDDVVSSNNFEEEITEDDDTFSMQGIEESAAQNNGMDDVVLNHDIEEEDETLFIPHISYRQSQQTDDDSIEEIVEHDNYDHTQWTDIQKRRRKQALELSGQHESTISDELLSNKSKTIFTHVINTGIHSERAVYAPRKWFENMLPQMSSDARKKVAADVFQSWVTTHSAGDDMSRLNKKLSSLQTQFDLHEAHLVKDIDDKKIYAQLTASPSIFVPLNTTIISGLTGTAGTDKLDAVQYDGPELSPLGQFLKSMNKHYKGEQFDGSGATLPQANKSNTLLNSSNDNISELSYRPGTVEAISTSTRGKGRSGTGESKVGRMGVQEELINTGTLNAGQYEGGHLIGDQIMDPKKFDLYESWNLAPQENEFNAPVYSSAIENGATKSVDNGNEVHVKAEVSYPSDTYEVPVLDVVDRVMDGKNTTIGSSTVSWYDGVDYIQKHKKALPTKFKFMTRIPGYWHANAKDSTSSKSLAGSVTQRNDGVQVTTAITANSVYNPTGQERFRFAIFTDGDSKTGTALPLPQKPLSKPKSTYKNAQSVFIYARQKTSVVGVGTGASANNIRTMSVPQINVLVKNITRSNAIKTWLTNNPNDHTVANLKNVNGVGVATLNKIITAGWTI